MNYMFWFVSLAFFWLNAGACLITVFGLALNKVFVCLLSLVRFYAVTKEF